MKPVSKTAFYCCAIRAWDAETAAPVLGDQYAKLFLTDEAREAMEPFRAERYPNAANVVRPRVIEDALRADLAADPKRRIVLLGAGFDTRAFRLPGGRWVEIDEEAVIAHKEQRLAAASAPNELVRIPVDFATQSLTEILAPYRGEAGVIVVVEGVSMYLTQAAIAELARSLTATFPRHALMADLVTSSFMRQYGPSIERRIAALGARFGELVERPEAPFLDAGYRAVWQRSLMKATREYRAAPIPWIVLHTLLRKGIRGSQVWRFEFGGSAGRDGGPPASRETKSAT